MAGHQDKTRHLSCSWHIQFNMFFVMHGLVLYVYCCAVGAVISWLEDSVGNMLHRLVCRPEMLLTLGRFVAFGSTLPAWLTKERFLLRTFMICSLLLMLYTFLFNHNGIGIILRVAMKNLQVVLAEYLYIKLYLVIVAVELFGELLLLFLVFGKWLIIALHGWPFVEFLLSSLMATSFFLAKPHKSSREASHYRPCLVTFNGHQKK